MIELNLLRCGALRRHSNNIILSFFRNVNNKIEENMSKSFVFCVNIFVLRKNGAYPAEKDTVTETSSPGHSITFSLNLYVHLLCPRV